MTTLDLADPAVLVRTLEGIERDLAVRQATLESAARQWYMAKRERERQHAIEFLRAAGTVAERNATADMAAAAIGAEHEAEFEATRAVVRVLEVRASVCQTLVRTQRERG